MISKAAIGGLLVLAALATVATSGAATRGKATLVVVSNDPITVAGRNFASRDRVTIRISVSGRELVKVVRATPTGRFTSRFLGVSASECAPIVAIATGRSGSRATTRKIEIPPACGMSPQPGVPPTQP